MAQITQIQVRRDVAATWTSVNPTLAAGEIGFETDTGKFKIGDGALAWNSLPYATDGSKLTGTIVASTAPASGITGTTLASNVTGSSLTSVGTIGSGTWNGGIIQPTYGGTGNIYGSALVGRATLSADRTKASTSTTPEDVFWNAGGTAVQYFNLDADTLYSFDGYVQVTKDSTSALPRAALTYYSTGVSTLTPQAVACEITSRANTAVIGLIDITSANTATNSNGSASTLGTFHYNFSGFIRTHATTAGRFNLALGLSATATSAPVYKAGSTISLYKHGSGNAVNFGNWTA